MDTLTIIALALILYGILTLYIAFAKPKAIWNIGKIQGFVQLLSEKGTVIFFSIVGVGTIVGGFFILMRLMFGMRNPLLRRGRLKLRTKRLFIQKELMSIYAKTNVFKSS